jgi:hypothetical protein
MNPHSRRRWILALGAISIPRLRSDEVVTNVVAVPFRGTYDYTQEIWKLVYWKKSMDQTRQLDMVAGNPAWKQVINEYWSPEAIMPGGYAVSKVTRTYTRQKASQFELASTGILTTVYAGSNPPAPTTTTITNTPVGIGAYVGSIVTTASGGTTRDSSTYSPVTFWARGAEQYPQGLNYKALLTNEYTGAWTNIGGPVYPYQTNLITISAPGVGLWWIRSVTFSH